MTDTSIPPDDDEVAPVEPEPIPSYPEPSAEAHIPDPVPESTYQPPNPPHWAVDAPPAEPDDGVQPSP